VNNVSEFEKSLESTFNDLGEASEILVDNFIKIFTEGIKELFNFRFLNKIRKKKKVLTILVLIILTLAMYFKSEYITKAYSDYLMKFDNNILNSILYKELITKLLSSFFILSYILVLGNKRLTLINDIHYNMNAIGFVSRDKKIVKDSEGKKVSVNKTPRFLNHAEVSVGLEMYLFSLKGTTMDQWTKYKPAIEDFLRMKVVKMDKTKSGGSIRLVVADQIKYDEIMYENKLIEEYDNKFESIGLMGKGTRERKFLGVDLKEKNYPIFKKEEIKVINKKEVKTITFKSIGTELEDWKASKYKMENVFNCIVHEIKQTKNDKQLFEIVTLELKDDLKDMYPWNDNIIDEKEGVLIIGEGLLDKIRLDLNQTPHVLVGGVTNSGKSVLINCIIWQAIKQGCYIIPVDFKGGIELGMFESFNDVISEEKEVLINLKRLKKEHEARLEVFKEYSVKNMVAFNSKVDEKNQLARIILAVDEIAELLDKTGKNKEQKDLIEAIEAELNTLARLSRSTGINIITGTQRPDSNVIKGQIKNNLGARICGRMTDKEPSIMVLGSPDATRIPDIKGRYLFSTGADPVPLQAYFFKEEYVKPGNYRKGILLTIDENDRKVNTNKKASGINLDKEIEESEEVEYVDAEFERLKKEDPDELERRISVVNYVLDKSKSEDGKSKSKKRDPLEDEEDQEPIEEIIDMSLEDEDEPEDDLYNGEEEIDEEVEVEEVV
jgi:S-DNA-T family DNA segregation ATPase FtsK/SpoIIIE